MKKVHISETPATQFLRQHKVPFEGHAYDYVEHGGTTATAHALNVDEHQVIKTLVMEDETASPLIILMHGDCKVSTKALARQAGHKKVEPCKPETANRHSGFLVGGTSPFGTKKRLPVFMEKSILDLSHIYINGGRRGYLVYVSTEDVVRVLSPVLVEVALQDSRP